MIRTSRQPWHAVAALLLSASAAVGFAARSANAQPSSGTHIFDPEQPTAVGPVNAPAGARRITARFAFEPDPDNPRGLPTNWIRAQHDPPNRDRPGFPIWNLGTLDDEVAFAGQGSVRLDTEGGSASLLLDPGVVQVFPDADYAVVARVRTSGVTHARARLAARLLDRAGNPIPGSDSISDPIRTRGTWEHVTIRVAGDYPDAISLQIELLLEQPGPDPYHPHAPFEIKRQDYQGSAWFDELAVLQIPRIEAWLDQPGNIVASDDTPAIHVFARDLVNEPLTIDYTLTDPEGTIIDGIRFPFGGGRFEDSWMPKVERFGWYHASVTIRRQGVRIGSAETAFIWTPPRPAGASRPGARDPSPFSISVQNVPNKGLGELGETALRARTPRVFTSLYERGNTLAPDRVGHLAELANRLAREGAELGLTIDALPAGMSAQGGAAPVLRAMGDPDADGAAWLDAVLVELGHRVRRWRTGSFDEHFDTASLATVAPAAERLRGFVPGAILELAWPPFTAIDQAAMLPGVALAQPVDPSVIPSEIPSLMDGYARAINSSGLGVWQRPEHAAVFRVRDPEDELFAIDEAVLGAVHAWVGFADSGLADPSRGRSLRLDDGWAWQSGRRPQLVPRPIAAAWVPLMDSLAGRTAQPLDRVAPGVRGVLLTPNRSAGERTEPIAVFWSDPGPDRADTLTLLLSADRVTASDVFGNTEAIEIGSLPNSNVRAHTIDLSEGPVFVTGVDPELLRFLASVHLDPPMVQSNTEPQEASLVFGNPWGSSVQGNYFIIEPGNLSSGTRATQDRRWDITPRFGSFVTGVGASSLSPIVFDVSPAIPAGLFELVVDLELTAPTVNEFVRLERTIEVGLEDVTMHLVASFEPDPEGPDLVVYAIVENTGTTVHNATLKVNAEGYAPQRAASAPIFPGRRMIKPFVFKDGRELLRGQDVVAGLTIRESGSRLRSSITIDPGP